MPRTMIPSAAISSGTASVDAIEPKATGYAVQHTTSTKISQTWLASHTADIDRWVCSRTAAARRPAGNMCQIPAPKSAPASTA
jgi:hypothetical protein